MKMTWTDVLAAVDAWADLEEDSEEANKSLLRTYVASLQEEATMNILRRAAMWLVWRGPRILSPLGPWLFGFAIGSKGVMVKGPDKPDEGV